MTPRDILNQRSATAPIPTDLWPVWDETLGEFGEYVMLDRDGVVHYGRSESQCLVAVREANTASLKQEACDAM
jgi:hypothetical protein